MQETGILRSSHTISRYHDPVKYLDLCIVIDITALTIYAGVYAVPYNISVGFIHETITVHIKGQMTTFHIMLTLPFPFAPT